MRNLFTLFLSVWLLTLSGQKDTSSQSTKKILPEVSISADRTGYFYFLQPRAVQVLDSLTAERLQLHSFSDVLKFALNVDIRERGMPGIQSDIQLQGGTFEQTLILINGIPVNDPQTGHFSSNIPIDPSLINKIEILSGASARVFGLNASGGIINIVTKKRLQEQLRLTAAKGMHKTFKGSVSAELLQNNSLLANLNYSQSAGYLINTDYKMGQSYLQFYKPFGTSQNPTNLIFFTLNGIKSFGAYNFYTPKFPYQFERNISNFVGMSLHKTFNAFSLHADAYLRRHQDRFELFRHDIDTLTIPAWYKSPNYHLNYSVGTQNFITYEFRKSKILTGFHLRNDLIYSNVLGNEKIDSTRVPFEHDGYFTKKGNRFYASIPINYIFSNKKWLISTGAMLTYYDPSHTWNFLPGADISYSISQTMYAYFSANLNNRMPTFTEMFYTDAAHQGNEKLTPEKIYQTSMGFRMYHKWFQTQVNGFYKYAEDLIDWVKNAPSDKWQTANLPSMKMIGMETFFLFNIGQILVNTFKIGYAQNFLIDYERSANFSKYAMDYLEKQFLCTISTGNFRGGSVDMGLTYQDRHGSFLDAKGNEIKYRPVLTYYTKLNYNPEGKLNFLHFYALGRFASTHTYYVPNVEVMPVYLEMGLTMHFKHN